MTCRWYVQMVMILFLSSTQCVEFLTFLGKTADPCNAALNYQVASLTDCPVDSQLAPPTVTVLLPSVTSIEIPEDPHQYTGISSHYKNLTLTASGLPLAYNTTYLALATASGSCSSVDNATTVTAITSAVQGTLIFRHNLDWVSAELEKEETPRLMCWSPDTSGWQYVGFKVKVTWNCNTKYQSTGCTSDERQELVTNWTTVPIVERIAQLQSTTCCKGTQGLRVGQCTNQNRQGCCGGTVFVSATQRCCNTDGGHVVDMTNACPCDAATSFACPPEETCCVNQSATSTSGICYRQDTQQCCNTGEVFNPGVSQCCRITGVQSLDAPCPCVADEDCTNLAGDTGTQLCCMQTAPPISMSACNSRASANSSQQSCLGQCFDARYGICCNGQLCRKHFESCCNATCCNMFTSSCLRGVRAGATGVPTNPLYYHSSSNVGVFDVCSAEEHLDGRRGFWVYVLPALLLVASFLNAFIIGMISRWATVRKWSSLEWAMVGLGCITMAACLPLYYAPTYKYAIWVFWAQILIVLTATLLLSWLNIMCIVICIVTVIYLLDPFYGNAILTLSSDRQLLVSTSRRTPMSSGILAFISNFLPDRCVEFYRFFHLDAELRDISRLNNPAITTWGYCASEWSTALLFLGALLILLTSLQLLLALIGLLTRFRRHTVEITIIPVAPD